MAENTETMNPKKNDGAEGADNAERKRRRGHRGGRNHKHHREGVSPAEQASAPVREAAVADAPADGEKKKNDRKAEQKNDQRKEKKADAQGNRQGAQRNERRDGGKGKRGQGKNGGYRPDHLSQKDDIYGDPREERELAEWRAKIVLNAEPVTPTAAPAPAPASETVEDSVELPEGIDLFESPVMATDTDKNAERVEVIGIRFRSAGKTYYFDPKGKKVQKGAFAIVETARGPEFGEIYLSNTSVKASETVTPLRPLLRVATEEDIAHNEENRKKEREALTVCAKKIEEHKLPMKLIDVQYAFDNSKLLFYFASEGRVDFRELVKDLASVFRTRIELRQIGIRDEAKMLGGLGACGRALCCSTFLPDFAQVSIKMAKEQGLSLNSTKISGMCGRLMCCLRFESDVYAEEIRRTPSQGSLVKTEDGDGTVISTNPLAGTVRVVLRDAPDTPPKQYHRDNVTLLPKEKHHADAQDRENKEKQEK